MTSSQDPNLNPNNVRGRVASSDEVAYRDGYVQAQANEERIRRAEAAARVREEAARAQAADEGAASGLLAGLLIAIIALCIGGGLYYLYRGSEATTEPNAETPVNRETTVIERTIDRSREVVQPPAVDTPDVNLPDVNINVPEVNTPEVAPPSSNDVTTPAENQPAETAPSNTSQETAPAEPAQ